MNYKRLNTPTSKVRKKSDGIRLRKYVKPYATMNQPYNDFFKKLILN